VGLQHFTDDMFKAAMPKLLQSGIAFYLMLLSASGLKMNADKICVYKVFHPLRHTEYSVMKSVPK